MLIISMRFFDAGRSASVSLMAGRAAELLRIVNLQQLGLRMAENACAYSSGFFSPLAIIEAGVIFSGSRVFMWQDSQRSTILASATLICTIAGSHSSAFFFRPSICCGVRSTI